MPDASRQTPHNVILIGFMGSGKSTVARELSRLLDFGLIDTDEKIVERAGKPITEIFSEVGEAGFREIESGVLSELVDCDRQVISTGGGVVTQPTNVDALRSADSLCLGPAVVEEVERHGGRARIVEPGQSVASSPTEGAV